MTSEPSTSTDSLETERTLLLQQALSQAKVQKQKTGQLQPKTPHKLSPEAEKCKAHPLMPIVELLLSKCERAANTLQESNFDMEDVTTKFNELQSQGVTGNTDDEDIDDLMKKSILALRTCLVEMERVSKLADSFKKKYLASLKRSVCHEALIGSNGDSDDEMLDSSNPNELRGSDNLMETALATLQTVSGPISIPLHIPQQSITMIPQMSQIQQNIEFMRKFGYPEEFIKKLAGMSETTEVKQSSPEKSEEEKQLLCDLGE